MNDKKHKRGFDRFIEALTGTTDEVIIQNEEQENLKVQEVNKNLINLESEEKEVKIKLKEEVRVVEPVVEVLKEEKKVSEVDECQNIISTPKEFEDVRKIANFIKQNKVVTLNLEELDVSTKQRIIDFLSGTISITEAKFEKITKSVYIATPKNVNVLFDNVRR